MKVGILTFPNSVSYGASLQMHALYRAIQQMGHDAEVINYHSAYMRAEKHVRRRGAHSAARAAIQRRLRRLMHHRLYAAFRRFEREQNRLYPRRPFSNKAQLKKIGNRYDTVVCGSDQVWNPLITGGDLSYFLDFCGENTHRVSYAPSFGLEQLDEPYGAAIRPELERFSSLSIREEEGRRLVADLTERDATVVCDPTFLIDVADWMALEQPHPAAAEEYVLYFTVKHSQTLFDRCCAWARQHGMKVVAIGGNFLTNVRKKDPLVEYAVDVGPEQWLYLIHHARYVFTNSFHGTAFSVIYQKDFYIEYPARTNCRLAQVLRMLDMEHRVIQEGQPLPEEAAPHAAAQPALQALVAASRQYLEEALREH